MKFRKYDHEKDKKAVYRIWNETGWTSKEDSIWMKEYIPTSRSIVAELNGEAECLVISNLGDYNYNDDNLVLSAICGVTTSLIARKQKFALRLTAEKMAQDAIDGADVAGLGIFDQGFYNMLGFGNGCYEHRLAFSPATLNVKNSFRVPERLNLDNLDEIHELRTKRLKVHGSVNLPKHHTKADLQEDPSYQGYGFRNEKGELTHLLWLFGKGKEQGPFSLHLLYQTYEQFMEILAFIKSFGEQIHLVRMLEPAGIQFQDFIHKPFVQKEKTFKGRFENTTKASSHWQMRILNLEKCISKVVSPIDLKFNLKLSDPIAKYLSEDSKWKGVTGDYIVSLGKESMVAKGYNNNLPTLECTINAFSRYWSGALKASILKVSDDFSASNELAEQLEKAINLPKPHYDWDF